MRVFQILAIAALTVLPMGLGQATPVRLSAAAPQPGICQLRGAVFIESVAAFANYRVYVSEMEAFADLVVYEVDEEGWANDPGFWYFTDIRGFADFTVYMEDVPGFSDFTIAFTDFRTAAGCPRN